MEQSQVRDDRLPRECFSGSEWTRRRGSSSCHRWWQLCDHKSRMRWPREPTRGRETGTAFWIWLDEFPLRRRMRMCQCHPWPAFLLLYCQKMQRPAPASCPHPSFSPRAQFYRKTIFLNPSYGRGLTYQYIYIYGRVVGNPIKSLFFGYRENFQGCKDATALSVIIFKDDKFLESSLFFILGLADNFLPCHGIVIGYGYNTGFNQSESRQKCVSCLK